MHYSRPYSCKESLETPLWLSGMSVGPTTREALPSMVSGFDPFCLPWDSMKIVLNRGISRDITFYNETAKKHSIR